jgi:hypothetical protein
MLNKFLSKVIWVDFKTKRVLPTEQQTRVQKIPYLCKPKKEHCNANSKYHVVIEAIETYKDLKYE